MRRVAAQAHHLGLFVLAPLVTMAMPFVVIPAVSATAGASGWAAVAVALAVGGAGAVLAELGWSLDHVQQITLADERRRHEIWTTSLGVKALACFAVAPAAAVAAALIVDQHRLAAAAVAAGTVLTGAFAPGWFFVGAGRPGAALLCEALPRAVLLAGAATAMALGAPVEAYGLALLLGPVLSVLASHVVAGLPVLPSPAALAAGPAHLRGRWTIVRGRAISTVYTMLPAAVLGVVAPGTVAAFSASDRPARMGFGVLAALPARLQSWLGASPDHTVRARRIRTAVLLNTGAGIMAAAVFVLAMPLVTPVLFAGTVELSTALLVASGTLVIVMSVSRGFALGLVTTRAAHRITTAVTAAALVGLPALVGGALVGGATGAVLGLVAAEATGVVVQAALLRSTLANGVDS